jgi:predicted metalloendopeptidase
MLVFKRQLTATIVTLRNVILSSVMAYRGFDKIFKAELAGTIDEASTEATRKCFALMRVFAKALGFFVDSLPDDAAKSELNDHVSSLLKTFRENIGCHHKTKTLFDKDTTERLVEKLLNN